jgi:hypothetical protein
LPSGTIQSGFQIRADGKKKYEEREQIACWGTMGLSNPFMALAPPINTLALVLVLCALSFCSADGTETSTSPPAITEAPVFLPGYEAKSWSLMRGSIIDINSTARETTYTIFCGVETLAACDLSLEFPFVIVEGPRTLKFHGTYTST